MWFKRKENKNRRLHRHNVLDVKLRSDQVRASRMRLGVVLFLAVAGPFFGLYPREKPYRFACARAQ